MFKLWLLILNLVKACFNGYNYIFLKYGSIQNNELLLNLQYVLSLLQFFFSQLLLLRLFIILYQYSSYM